MNMKKITYFYGWNGFIKAPYRTMSEDEAKACFLSGNNFTVLYSENSKYTHYIQFPSKKAIIIGVLNDFLDEDRKSQIQKVDQFDPHHYFLTMMTKAEYDLNNIQTYCTNYFFTLIEDNILAFQRNALCIKYNQSSDEKVEYKFHKEIFPSDLKFEPILFGEWDNVIELENRIARFTDE